MAAALIAFVTNLLFSDSEAATGLSKNLQEQPASSATNVTGARQEDRAQTSPDGEHSRSTASKQSGYSWKDDPNDMTDELAELKRRAQDQQQYIEDLVNNSFGIDEMIPPLKTLALLKVTGRSSPESLEQLVEVLNRNPDIDFTELQRDIVLNHKNDSLTEQDVMAKIKVLKDNQVFEDSALSVTKMAKAAAFNNYSDVLHSMTKTDSWADIPAASKAEFVNMAIAAYSSKYHQNTVTPEDKIKLSSMLDRLYQLGIQSNNRSLRLMDLVGLSGTDVYLKAFEQQLEVED